MSSTRTTNEQPFLERIGVPMILIWGFAGVFLFMIGDGVESNYLAPYFKDHFGFSETGAANVILFYGVFVAIGSYLAGTLSSFFGPKRVMVVGAIFWGVFEALFLLVALPSKNHTLIYACYGVRGVGYPLFAFAFLTWINLAVDRERRGRASGWFWFAFTGGLPVVGSAIAAATIPVVGERGTFFIAWGLVMSGGVLGLLACRERHGTERIIEQDGHQVTAAEELRSSISILWRNPLIGLATGLRTINTGAQYGFFVALPFFLEKQIGFSQTQYLWLIVLTFGANVVMNPISGLLSDRFGWRRSIQWLGGVGCTITTLLMYLVPKAAGHDFVVVGLIGILYGITLAGYVPLSAFMPTVVAESDRGNAMAMYAFAAGFSTVVGPLVFRALDPSFGIAGVMYVFAALYLVSAVGAHWLVHDSDPGEAETTRATPAISTG
ncbi:MAG: MFS transporter [Solirubrobacterales bacterium]|nr:MFS transporter [Solirubrobacterales bacterium]